MDEKSAIQYDYIGQTVLNPLGLIAILVLGTAMVVLPRRYAVWPMIIMGCFVSPAQRIVLFSLNFDLLRLMVLFGTTRVLTRGEWKGFAWRKLDTTLALFALVGTSVYIVQYGTLDAVKYKLGVMYDMLGMYFLFRCLIRDLEDVSRVAVGFAVVSVPLALAFLVEGATGRNLFAVFGGVREITWVRDGRLRCQGAYAHPILAGCYWASVLPLMAALWWGRPPQRWWGMIGVVCGLIVIVLCASSTPVSGVACGLLGAGAFAVRRWMRFIRWLVLVILVFLHFVMNAPVWHLISRIDLAGGSTGWHRFNLINQFILRVDEWWLLGIRGVEQWGVTGGDVTNQYALEGIRGGIWALGLFVVLIVMAFSRVGKFWRAQERSKANLMMSWALGVSLFIHCMMFLAVSYFGQITMVWYLTLAMIGSLSPIQRAMRRRIAVPRHMTYVNRFGGLSDVERR